MINYYEDEDQPAGGDAAAAPSEDGGSEDGGSEGGEAPAA